MTKLYGNNEQINDYQVPDVRDKRGAVKIRGIFVVMVSYIGDQMAELIHTDCARSSFPVLTLYSRYIRSIMGKTG